MLATDDERREVVRKLRDCPAELVAAVNSTDNACKYYILDLLECVGLGAQNVTSLFERLADLIEPTLQCPYYDSLRHWCSIHDVPAVDRDTERTWHDFADELPPANKPVLCKGRNGALYVGKPVTFVGGERTREVWVPRGDQYRKPEKWMEIDDD